ncbi:hypothetical protein ACIPYS_06615 [Kitasatospora sp. NPDC089913]|uniref:hypothetical protein n=1 Tax=Kitasatospora sp. NPDC089913 TaxID=3364080 RepID=UPI0038215E2D
MMKRVAAVALLTVTCACASGGNGSAPSTDRPPKGPDPAAAEILRINAFSARPVTRGKDIVLPLTPYLPTTAQINAETKAFNLRVRSCMATFGLDWRVPPGDAVDPSTAPSESRRYGVIDAAEVERLGYHAPGPVTEEKRPGDEGGPGGNVDTKVLNLVFLGKGESSYGGRSIPAGGCAGEANRLLNRGGGPSSADDQRFTERLIIDSFERSKQEKPVVEAMAAWSACMKKSGYDYQDIWKANEDPRWTAAEPTPQEFQVARADVGCKQEANLPGIWFAVETVFEQKALEANAPALKAAQDRHSARIRTAADIVAGIER